MTSTNRRLVEYHVERLKNKDPEIRKRSIEELRLLGDSDALEHLERVFRTDDDPEVRKLAQQAGRELYFRNRQQPGGQG